MTTANCSHFPPPQTLGCFVSVAPCNPLLHMPYECVVRAFVPWAHLCVG